MTRRTFNRIPFFDPRSRDFDVRTVADRSRPRNYTWPVSVNLDQGEAGYCVGFSWEHEGAAMPMVLEGASNAGAIELFKLARTKHDTRPLDGDDTDDGTYVLAGAKASQELGRIGEYRWAFTVQDALIAISRTGPAVLGITWKGDMMETDPNGFIHFSGYDAGGHAILARGVKIVWKAGTMIWGRLGRAWWDHVDLDQSYIVLHNSWGPFWGGTKHGLGTAKLSVRDFMLAMADNGECCVPVTRTKVD